jgi:hypothetical protein
VPPPAQRSLAAAWPLLLAAVFFAEAVYVLRLPLPDLVALIPDDSFFFLRVAQEVVAHGTFSFSEGVETYGFQPLWQLVLVGLRLSFADSSQLLYATLALCCALHVATGFVLWDLARALWGTAAGIIASAVWTLNPGVMVWVWGIKENALYALLLVLALRASARMLQRGATTARAVGLGVWLGLAVFTRVNASLTAAVLLLVFVLSPAAAAPLRARARAAVVAGVTAAVVCAPWYAFASWRFGTALPTSGTWKLAIMRAHVEMVWNTPWLSLEHLRRSLAELPAYLHDTLASGFGPIAFAWVGLAAAALLTLPLARGAGGAPGAASVAVGAGLAALVAAAANVLLLVTYVAYAKWYTVAEYVAVALLSGMLAARAARLLRAPLTAVVTLACVGAAAILWPAGGWLGRMPRGLLDRAPAHGQTLEIGLWAGRNVPDDATVAIWDPGVVSFFSGKRFLSLDPLMNSLEYQQKDLADTVGYCRRHGVSYVFGAGTRSADGRYAYRYLSPEAHEVVWVPFPEFPLPWQAEPPLFYMVARVKEATGPDFIRPEMLPFGLYRPNDARTLMPPDREAEVARALAGLALDGEALRVRLHDGVRAAVALELDGQVVGRSAPEAGGWGFFDAWGRRGARARILVEGADGAAALREVHRADFRFPVPPQKGQ